MKRFFTILLSIFTLCALLLPTLGATAERERKTVRVGYVNVKGYEEGGPDEYKTGFGYEYLQKIAYYTGWKYEYVYGSFPQLLNMLQEGKIDIMGNVTNTPQRAQKMYFSSHPQGSESFYVYTAPGNKSLIEGDYKALQGKRIAVARNTFQSHLVDEYFAKLGISVEKVELSGAKAIVKALKAGQVEAAVMTGAFDYGYVPIHNIGFNDYYFAVAKDKKDLLVELDEAMFEIQNADPNYNAEVARRYSFGTVGVNHLTQKEKGWLKTKNNTIKIGYLENNLPYSATDSDGQLIGILKILVDKLAEQYGIKLEAIPYKTVPEAREAINKGLVDCGGPFYEDYYLAEMIDKSLTESIVTTTPVMLYKDTLKTDTIAVTTENMFYRSAVKTMYPKAKLLEFDSIEECMNAVAKGKADCTLVTSGKLNVLHKFDSMKELKYTELMRDAEIGLFVNRGQTQLLKILNKGIFLSRTQMKGATFVTSADSEGTVSLEQILRDNMAPILMLVTVIVAVMSLLMLKMHKAEQKAKSAEAAKTTFLNNMSHDIRTPMNAILGFTKLMETELNNPEAAKDYLKKIDSSGKYLLTIINDTLDMARIESGKVTIDESVVDLKAFQGTVLSVFEDTAKSKGLVINARWNIENRYIYADVAKCQQIAVNIISNAVKYTPSGGKITITVDEKMDASKGYANFCLTIADTGIGMSKEFQKDIFEAFSRERNTTQSKINGTGLGMAIVKRLVDLMGGTISVESELGKGTTFRVVIPLRIAEAPQEYTSKQEEAASILTSFKGKRILMAEDNEINAEIAIAILEDEGFVIEHAVDGIECVDMLSKAEAGYYDVVLMDIQMPNLDGYGATEKIRKFADKTKASIPILAMTANAFEEDRKKSLAAGMNGFCTKPIDVAQLNKELARVLA